MNESADENESLVSASGTSHLYPTWEAKEVADAIDRIRRKRLSSRTILEGPATRMTSIHAKVLSTEKFRDQYRLIVQLVPSEFLGPFERLRFKKNPYCGSFGTSLAKSWLTLDYRKDPGFKAGEAFPLRRTD